MVIYITIALFLVGWIPFFLSHQNRQKEINQISKEIVQVLQQLNRSRYTANFNQMCDIPELITLVYSDPIKAINKLEKLDQSVRSSFFFNLLDNEEGIYQINRLARLTNKLKTI